MRPDNSHHLVAAARRRSDEARQRAASALRRLDATTTAVTIGAVAREAGVSRSWIYSQPDLRAQIDRLRNATRSTRPPVPARQRASDNSLRQRLDLATARIRQVEADNTRLRRALAEALGDNRANPTRDTRTRQVPRHPPPRPQTASATPSTTQTPRSPH